jgi:hydroxyacylglutathione hydrolase
MKIHQFEDKGLSHYSYAILSESQREIVLIDPGRIPYPYYEYASGHDARIVGIIQTHPHADFVSSHLEIHLTTGAPIYAHSLVEPDFSFVPFDEGQTLSVGNTKFKSLHTPGHSPDSISVVIEYEDKARAVFTGDTLFVGDVGRPDLRDNGKDKKVQKEKLARMMYHSTRNKLMKLPDEVVVYPAHGAGTLCGKGLSDANSSTIGQEKNTNPALQPMTEDEFVKMILEDQPFIPKYFGYNVDLNKQGAPGYQTSVDAVGRLETDHKPRDKAFIIDGRPQGIFKQGYLRHAFNIQEGNKFETWLGSILGPDESFYLVAESDDSLEKLIGKAAKIGYEGLILGTFVMKDAGELTMPFLNVEDFSSNPDRYTIVDIRNASETEGGLFFDHALTIPLPELRERTDEIPRSKPVVVHCSGGYRSAAGSSIVAAALPDTEVYDLGESVKEFES